MAQTCLWCPAEVQGLRSICAFCRDESNGYSDARERRPAAEHGSERYMDGFRRGQEMNAILALRQIVVRPEDAGGALAGARQSIRLMQWWAERAMPPILEPESERARDLQPGSEAAS